MTKLEKVINKKIELGCSDRQSALIDIALSIDIDGMWNVAKTFGVLDENRSAEDFALEFMTAYNNEISPRY